MKRLPREFRPVFRYRLVDGKVADTKILDGALWKERGVVYARVCNKVILYIGKTDGRISTRIGSHLRRYLHQPQNALYRDHIKQNLVTIYAYKPKTTRLFDLDIDLHSGVEAALIKAIKPRFVKRI